MTFHNLCCYNRYMAGKSKSPDLVKTYMLRVRMTDEERKLLERAAMARSLDVVLARSELVAPGKTDSQEQMNSLQYVARLAPPGLEPGTSALRVDALSN